MIEKNRYVLDIDYSKEQQDRLKLFCRLITVKPITVRQFVTDAVNFYMKHMLGKLKPQERSYIQGKLDQIGE
jgi:hypothetical protein